jgi:hypothetical protein
MPEPPTVDDAYLATMVREAEPRPCDGCGRFVRPRHAVRHAHTCHHLLSRRLAEGLQEGRAKDKQYRNLAEENELLRLRVADMTYRLNLAHLQYRRAFRVRYGIPMPQAGQEDSEQSESEASDMDLEEDRATTQTQAAPSASWGPPAGEATTLPAVVDSIGA